MLVLFGLGRGPAEAPLLFPFLSIILRAHLSISSVCCGLVLCCVYHEYKALGSVPDRSDTTLCRNGGHLPWV